MARIRRPGESAPTPAPTPAQPSRNRGGGSGGGKKSHGAHKTLVQGRRTERKAAVDAGTQAAESSPEGAWANYWQGHGIGMQGPQFQDSAFQRWFTRDYYDELRGQWEQAKLANPTAPPFWQDWLAGFATPENLRSRWAQQSMMTKGLMGNQQINWLAF